MRLLIKKANPLDFQRQKTQSKSGKIAVDKTISMSSKLKNTLPENMDIRSTVDTSVSLPPLDYNIVDDMKKT